MPEIRRDPISGNWVVVGYKYISIDNRAICPFCPGNEDLTPPTIREVKDETGSWRIRCFPSRNFLFVIEASEEKRAEGLYDKMSNLGAHEIIVETPEHAKIFSNFTEKEVELLFRFYQERVFDLKRDKRFRYIQVFKNYGELAGSYIFHPHSHVLATPILPQRIEHELKNAKEHYMRKERCLFCDVLRQEVRDKKRVVIQNVHFVAFCPFASRFPFETWIVPKQHKDSFEDINEEEVVSSFTQILLNTMKRIEKLTNAYTIVYHTSPNFVYTNPLAEGDSSPSNYFHWHVEIMPRDFRSSKYKREDEFYVTALLPEEAAAILRAQKV
ncbi:MAG: galactose-1-phosphate uridylyltransferase [Deltaproteobacteria bacterium]|nr:galactose-1-phosphate uridylyltransferase [Deltaproteobacteria bacterium]